MHERFIVALTRQLERIADTYEEDLCWRKRQAVETHLSVADQAALDALVMRGDNLVKTLRNLADKLMALDSQTHRS